MSGASGNGQDVVDVVKVSEIERLLGRVPGVLTARLVVDDWGAIQEVHILATTERGAKQLVRDVESTLAARWGIKIDHKKISVARLQQASSALPPVRLRLRGVTASSEPQTSRYDVRVQLTLDDDEHVLFEGAASGSPLGFQQPLTVAAATISALNRALQPGHQLVLEEARVLHLAGREVAVVIIAFFGPRGHQQVLAGAQPVAGDPVQDVIRACLQATNRIMERLVRRQNSGETPLPDPVNDGRPTA